MSKIIGKLSELSKDEWLALRGLGSSDAAAICGLNKFKTPAGVWAEKVGLIKPFEGNEATEWGTKLEPVVAQAFSDKTGIEIKKNDNIYAHDVHPFLTATPDYVLSHVPSTLLEIKTTSSRNESAWSDGIPDYTHVQVMHQMLVTGADLVHIACLVGGQKLIINQVRRDEKAISAILDKLLEFWKLIETKTAPPMTEHDSDLLQELYPQSNELTVTLVSEAEQIMTEYLIAKTEIERFEKMANMKANLIKQLLKENEVGESGKMQAKWKTVSSSHLNTKALKENESDIYEQYCETSLQRRFTVSEKRGEGNGKRQ